MKKKLFVIILSLVLAVCMVAGVACDIIPDNHNPSTDNNKPSSSGTSSNVATKGDAKQLQVLKSELKLTQEQVASQIKAEYLIENNGYKEDDEVVVIISLTDKSLLEVYNDDLHSAYGSVADYATSASGAAYTDKLISEQNSLVTKLKDKGMITDVLYNYTTVMNAVAVKMQYRYVNSVEGVKGVSYAMMSETFNRPQAIDSDNVSTIVNQVEVYPTGIFNPGIVEYTGKGTAVAILDSGFDIEHEVFTTMPNVAKDDLLIQRRRLDGNTDTNKRFLSEMLHLTTANKLTRNLDITDVYYNAKIPFMYDYADKDPDVKPYYSEHGTHVAGIIAGQSDVITGIALDTQLVLLKVFPDLDDGGRTEDILAGLEDAVLLKVDAINMSLGSSCGFARDYDNQKLNEVYDSINDAGISLITAASNSYSSGFGGAQGNTNMVTNPDSGTVGSPSTYGAALSVASISGVKSKYLVADGKQVVFFNESNNIAGKANNFFDELYASLNKSHNEILTLDYVVVPGTGLRMNYSSIDVKGKIAVVRRGGNSFEEKAQIAAKEGAVACIIYNNLDGDILMSMGKSDHIPTVSISKDNGVALMQKGSGKMVVNYKNEAGPFMSDFSSWGPTPSLQLKPEITAHGGTILSAVPNGGYDELSGTSMASPNLCGLVILIRQFLRDNYPDKSWKEISTLANQMLMSTATIVMNEEANPYSPRKQGAGLASLKNVVNTNAYLTVDNIDKTKIELGDDPQMLGVYRLTFNVVNVSDKTLTYDMSVIGMTESVSTSDDKHVAEKSQLLNGDTVYSVIGNGTLSGDRVTVNPNGTVQVTAIYILSYDDRALIENLFPYGMYVEGFVKLVQVSNDENKVDLNVPFLGFYGDWTRAPMFDKTYYEVENERYDTSIEDDDKLQADYYATTPYGAYYYNYIIPLGTYLYNIDTTAYDPIPASEEHIAMSNVLGTIDGINAVYAGLLRCAKQMNFTITDKVSGEVMWEHTDYNARKSYSLGGEPIPYYDYLHISSLRIGLVNNRQYEFKMEGLLDYGNGGRATNVRNSFSFDFYFDDEAPVVKEVTYEKEYDDNLKKDRYYINLTIYDNHYTQSVTPLIFTSTSSYAVLEQHPIPVYGERNSDTVVRFEITSYLDDLFADNLITSALAFSIDDYALNSNIYICQLPGTRGDFKFTKDGDMDGTDLVILSMYEGEIVNVAKYLATSDETVDMNKDYLKHLVWTSSNNKVAQVNDGQVKCLTPGRATVTVSEQMDGKQAVLIINVKKRDDGYGKDDHVVENINNASIEELRFSYFDTEFAYSRAAQTSEIGETGDRHFVSASRTISFYPGEKIKLVPSMKPWYVEDKYEKDKTYTSSNPSVATVDENGVVTGLKKGTTTISLSVKGSTLRARVSIEIKSEFVIENRTLIAYKGLGGKVVIPDDEGILYIGGYAFCLYDTDHSVELTEDDYDANKIPSMNTSVTEVVVPYGVEEIQKYAFYNCSALKSVTIPDTVKVIREFAFTGDKKLTTISLPNAEETALNLTDSNVETLGRAAFMNCTSLTNIDLSHIYALGANCFDGCTSLSNIVSLANLRNTGAQTFQHCTALQQVTLGEHTQLAYAMFALSGLTSVNIHNNGVSIPDFTFARCKNLESVTIANAIETIGKGAFSECPKLVEVRFDGVVNKIDEQAFYKCEALKKIALPNNEVILGNNAFYQCKSLEEITLRANTVIAQIGVALSGDELSSQTNFDAKYINGYVFNDTKLTTFVVDEGNSVYTVSDDGHLLLTDEGRTVILVARAYEFGDYTLPNAISKIGEGAFAGANITSIEITSKDTVIGDYAFAETSTLKTVTLPSEKGIVIGDYAFAGVDNEQFAVVNLENASVIGRYAFSLSNIEEAIIGSDVIVGEGAFFRSNIKEVTVGANTSFGLGAFQRCPLLAKVTMPEDGGVTFGRGCFSNATRLSEIDLSKVGTAEKPATIAAETFFNCERLTTAKLTYVKEIGSFAFAECSALMTVEMPIMEVIGEGAFSRYEQYGSAPVIKGIVLPDTLTKIGEGAFIGCEQLQKIVIPDGITEIPDYTFAYCLRITEVTLPDTVTKVGSYSFTGCATLDDINLENVQTIGDYAFTSCLELTRIDLTSSKIIGNGAFADTSVGGVINANDLESIGANAFQKNSGDITRYSSITQFNANSLKVIGQQAFDGNSRLADFVLSMSIGKIGMGAFNDCSKLTSFYYLVNNTKRANGIINDYAKLKDGVLYTRLASGDYQLTAVPGGQETMFLNVEEGTVRIEAYAGNGNKNITYIVLPDSLRLIGNYAFYGYDNLTTVEFRSVVAPMLEDSYNRSSQINENDPGYDDLHNQFDMFGFELYYYTFIDLVGKKSPITMVLPANEKLSGYDALPYQVYFGSVKDAKRSEYIAMETALTNFLRYVDEISAIEHLKADHEKLINNAIASYNAVTQDPTNYGITSERYQQMIATVRRYKTAVTRLKIANSTKQTRDVQDMIDELPATFTISCLTDLQKVYAAMSNLKVEERALLDMAKYNAIVAEYNNYVNGVKTEISPVAGKVSATSTVAQAVASISMLAVAAVALGKRIAL